MLLIPVARTRFSVQIYDRLGLKSHSSLSDKDIKMPIVKVFTNLSRNQLPADLMPRFCTHLAGILNKDPKAFKWSLDTDKTMAMVGQVPNCYYLDVNRTLWNIYFSTKTILCFF